MKKTFRPEFLNRVDEIIVFHPLDEDHIKQIVGLMLENLAARMKQNEISIQVTDNAKAFIAKKGFDPIYGARPLRRTIQNMIEDRIAEEMLDGTIKTGDNILVDVNGENIMLTPVNNV